MRTPKKQYRSGGTDSPFMIDREVRGIGRIHRTSGLTVEAQFRKLNEAIPELAKDAPGRAILAALRDGTLSGLQVYVALVSNDLASLSAGDAAAPLIAALEQWLEATEKTVAPSTRKGRGELVRSVRRFAKPTTRVADLPAVLRRMKLGMPSAREFNLELQYASAFVRDTLGRRHEVYLDVRDIDVRKTTPMTDRHPLTPAQVLALAAAFDRVWKAKRGSRGAEVFAMALTGMGPTEYWGRWSVLPDRVHIDGTKREGRVRDIPRLFPCAIYEDEALHRPGITPSSFARALNIVRVATGIDCTPYDLRRTFGNWMEAAQILRSRRKQYLGHAVGDVTERYERHEVTQHLQEDGDKLRAWIAASLANPRQHPEPGSTE